MNPQIKYRKPPIIERALVVHAPLSEEVFQLGAEEWAAKVKPEYPAAETVTEWLLALAEKNGMPVLDAEKQQMTIRQTFWKKKDGKKQKGIQLWGDKIAFNLIGSPGDPHHFEELEAIATPWLARWAEHFQIKRFCGVSMEYVNLLSQETMPTFMDGPTFKAGSVLVPIQHIPGPYHLLTTPYDFQMNFKIPNDTLNLRFTARCHSVKLEPLEMHLRFTAMTYDEVKNYTIDQIQDQIKVAHQLILTEFESFFTEGAKLTFEPYAPDHS